MSTEENKNEMKTCSNREPKTEVRMLAQSEKPDSRFLYETCFPEDTKEFTDYYYQEKCRDNTIYVLSCSGRPEEAYVAGSLDTYPLSRGACFEEACMTECSDGYALSRSARSEGACITGCPDGHKLPENTYPGDECMSEYPDGHIISGKKEICAMVHANPFRVSLCGSEARVNYLVAVATDPAFRRRGFMRQLLEYVLRQSYEKKEPFSFLMPANPDYYTPFGYRYWENQIIWKMDAASEQQCKSKLRQSEPDLRKKEAEVLARTSNEILSKNFDLYILRDASYYERVRLEQKSEGGDVVFLYDADGQPAGSFCFSMEDGFEVREPLIREALCMAESQEKPVQTEEITQSLPGKDSCTQDADQAPLRVIHTVSCTPFADACGGNVGAKPIHITETVEPMMMGRIVHLHQFVSLLRFPVPYEETLRITDDILPENNGVFQILIDRDGGTLKKADKCAKADKSMDIAEFGQQMFDRLRIFVNELV